MRQYLHALAFVSALAGAQPALAQMSSSDLIVRLEQIENQMRQLTGQVEQLQYRNQQLEQQLRRAQEENEYRFQEMGGRAGRPPAPSPRTQAAGTPGQAATPQSVAPVQQPGPVQQSVPAQPSPQAGQPGRRSDLGAPVDDGPSPIKPLPQRRDVFDPSANPTAPGAPRPLGSLPPGQPWAPVNPQIMSEEGQVGARGGREAGSPLDLSATLGGAPAADSAPAQRNPGTTLASVQPPTNSPKDHFDLAYGYILRKDYALAEESLRDFLRKYPGDRQSGDAQYWLGETLYQRQRYRDAAEQFLAVSTRYETSAKAPDSLLRLGQSLAALGEKDAACATFGEIGRKYPRASLAVKNGVEREQKRVRC
jgi:tol-pal system protein YbgF